MLKTSIETKRCLIVCGGGGVGKTTVAASIAIAATKARKRVLVVTIDPAKRLAEAFGLSVSMLMESREPIQLSDEIKKQLGVPDDSDLHVGLLNPKFVLDSILEQVLTPAQSEKLKKTLLFSQLSEMIYGLQEYTAYEWVTRMIQNNDYDLIVLDTPPAFHAKDFFNVPERVTRLMESRVFHLFMPKKSSWFKTALSFGWVEKLLGEKIYHESRVFFEIFAVLRDRILERCKLLAVFFTQKEVSVVAVSTPESTAQFELEGLLDFLRKKQIPVESILLNQVETASASVSSEWMKEAEAALGPGILEKIKQVQSAQTKRSQMAFSAVERCKDKNKGMEVLAIPMCYSDQGFDILTEAASVLK